MKHRIQVEDDQASEFRAWMEGLGAELRERYQTVLYMGYELDSREPSRHEVRVARVDAPDFSRRLPRLPLLFALQFLSRPFRIVLENSRADRNFLLSMSTKEQQDFLLRGEREGSIEFENGNGLESMDERALGLGTEPHAPLPAWLSFFLFDSDALQPGHPSRQSQQLKQTCDQAGVPHYQLRRRFIESYLPLRALSGWVNLAPNREGRAQRRQRYEAFQRLKRPEQRHHYNLKRGFEGDQKRIAQGETAGSLFDGVPEEVKRALAYGLDRDLSELYALPGQTVSEVDLKYEGGWAEVNPVISTLIAHIR